MIDTLLDYVKTDTICYWADNPQELHDKQKSEWGPVLQYISEAHKITPKVVTGVAMEPDYLESELQPLINYFRGFNELGIVGILSAVESLKSCWLAIAAVDGFIDSERAVELSRLEQMYQSSIWGNVAYYHDVEHAEICSRASAGILVAMCSKDLIKLKENM